MSSASFHLRLTGRDDDLQGGCGKTTILFHTAGEYASKHKDEKVLYSTKDKFNTLAHIDFASLTV